jgi:hypothetical protein
MKMANSRHEIKIGWIKRKSLRTRLEIMIYKHVVACLATELLGVRHKTQKVAAAKRTLSFTSMTYHA